MAFRADRSPFDAYLRGDGEALTAAQVRGMDLFYGAAGCSGCHAGKFQTDHKYHAIAMPQIGPGHDERFLGEDVGRQEKTLKAADRYKFRTPSLRNVELTAPYGHDGAFDSLEAVVRHHLDPVASLESYDIGQAFLPPREDLDALDLTQHNTPAVRAAIAAANELQPTALSDTEVSDLLAFLRALTDPTSRDMRRLIPRDVPSGLVVYD